MKTSEIKFSVTLDDKNMPQKIDWSASDGGVTSSTVHLAILQNYTSAYLTAAAREADYGGVAARGAGSGQVPVGALLFATFLDYEARPGRESPHAGQHGRRGRHVAEGQVEAEGADIDIGSTDAPEDFVVVRFEGKSREIALKGVLVLEESFGKVVPLVEKGPGVR